MAIETSCFCGIARGFRIETAAAEPLVEGPVALAWDDGGRMWDVEKRGHMRTPEGEGENDNGRPRWWQGRP